MYSCGIPLALHCLFNFHGELSYKPTAKKVAVVDVSEKIVQLSSRSMSNKVSPYSQDFVRLSDKDIEKGGKSKAKYGKDFLKPTNMVAECSKAIDEMDAVARGNTSVLNRQGAVSIRMLQGLQASNNGLFVTETLDSPDSVLAFAAEEGFL